MASDDFEAFYLAHYGRLVGQLLAMLGDLALQGYRAAGRGRLRRDAGRREDVERAEAGTRHGR